MSISDLLQYEESTDKSSKESHFLTKDDTKLIRVLSFISIPAGVFCGDLDHIHLDYLSGQLSEHSKLTGKKKINRPPSK